MVRRAARPAATPGGTATTTAAPAFAVAARSPLPQRRRPVHRRHGRGRHRRPRRARAGRRRRRPRRRRAGRPLRGQRPVGQLPVPQQGGIAVRGDAAGRGRGQQRRRRLPGGHGRRLRRRRRRRPARPGRDQLLRRVDDPLPEPRGGAFSPTQTAASGSAAPSRFLLGFGIAFLDYEQRRPARPGDGQWARERLRARGPLADARALLLAERRVGGSWTCSAAAGRPWRGPASAAAWRPATSITTVGSTS